MAKKIEKYQLSVAPGDQVIVTTGQIDGILSLQIQKEFATQADVVLVWALVHIGSKPSQLRFRTIISEKPVPDDMLTWWEHLATLQLRGGATVTHVFVERASSKPRKK
jgi:hypothetical protein